MPPRPKPSPPTLTPNPQRPHKPKPNSTTGDWCKNGAYTDLFASLGPAYSEVNAPNCSQKNQPPSCRYEDKIFADFAAAAVQNASASAPIFLYFAPHNCHLPLEVPAAQLAKFGFINDSDSRQAYSAMVNMVDAHIGQVVDAFKAKGLWDNTLMIVSADKCVRGCPVARFANEGVRIRRAALTFNAPPHTHTHTRARAQRRARVWPRGGLRHVHRLRGRQQLPAARREALQL